MFENEKKSPLDRLKKSLYSRNVEEVEPLRHDIHPERTDVAGVWAENTEHPDTVHAMKKARKAYSYIFLGSIAFFVIAAAIGGFTLFGGRNFISADNVDILVEGPVSIGGGEALVLSVSVVNKNSTDIELVDLIAEYPEGTKDPSDPEKDLSKVRVSLGNIASQSVAQRELSSLMFGEEGTEREILFTAEYRTADSNAIFIKEKTYRATISSSPVNVSIGALNKVLGGQTTDVTVMVVSNTTVPLKNLLLSLDYPFGFSVISSNPKPSYGANVWRIGDLAPGAKRIITLQARAEGQNDEERVLRATVGIESQANERVIGTTIVSREHSFSLERPFLALDLALDGERGDLAIEPGRSVRAEVIWTNNSQTRITNARIEAKLSGAVLDKSSVSVDGGYYDSLSNSVIWEAGRTPGLESIAPGEDGRASFTFTTTASSPGKSTSNPVVSITVSGKGSRIDDSGVAGEITAAISRSVKLISNLALTARALRSQGPIENSGPIPPKVDEGTTYTIVWTVTNTSNSITGARVTASLPSYVTWTGTISPAGANITYDPSGGNITWLAGSVPQNADVGSGAKQVWFQVSLRPSANQIGRSPDIIGAAKLVGTDTFAGVTIEDSVQPLSTRTSTDLLFKQGDDVVRK
jgi:hypothetical protein